MIYFAGLKVLARFIMSKEMSNIRSTLIKTCISNVQKELSQLEHWLQILPDEHSVTNSSKATCVTLPTVASETNDSIHTSIAAISNNLNNLIQTSNKHQQMIDYLTSRMQNIENTRTICRNADPWVDNNSIPLLNEIVNLNDLTENSSENDTESNCIYCVHKQDDDSESDSDVASVHPLLKTPEIHPNIPDDASDVPDIDEELNTETECITASSVINDTTQPDEVKNISHNNSTVTLQENTAVNTVEQQEQQEQQEEQGQEQEQEQQGEQEEIEEEEEEEEEEEGLELEEIEFKGIKYYKDGEGFIYSIIDDEPSENPIGYWKEKTQSIAFYKTK